MTDINALPTSLKPVRTKSELKAEVTDRTARAIIEAEAKRREAKTERLRRARLKSEAPAAAASSTGLGPAVGTTPQRKHPAKTEQDTQEEAKR